MMVPGHMMRKATVILAEMTIVLQKVSILFNQFGMPISAKLWISNKTG